MSARAPLTGGTDISGIYFVLKDVKTGTEVDNSWVGRGSEDTSVYSTSMYVDHASVVALAKHDLVMQAFAYRGTDSGSMVASATPARAMIYAKNRAQIQRVNRVRSTWNKDDGSLALTWNTELQRRRTSRDLQHLGCQRGSTHAGQRRQRSIFTDGRNQLGGFPAADAKTHRRQDRDHSWRDEQHEPATLGGSPWGLHRI
jgi:hypothetical protein